MQNSGASLHQKKHLLRPSFAAGYGGHIKATEVKVIGSDREALRVSHKMCAARG